MRTWMTMGAVVALAACGLSITTPTEPTVTVVGDTTFVELPIRVSVLIDDVSINFDRVSEDSRCPAGVTCVWEGNARVELTVSDAVDAEVLGLNTSTPPKQAAFSGLTIRLDRLDPYPTASQPLNPNRYVATLAVY